MQIHYLSLGFPGDDSVGPESEDTDIVGGVDSEVSNPGHESSWTPVNGIVLPVHDDSGDDCVGVVQLPCEPRNQRDYYPDLELLLVEHSQRDPFEDLVGNFVLDCRRGVAGHRDEELVLDVNKAPGCPDEVKVGSMDGAFPAAWLAPDRPAPHRPQHLAGVLVLDLLLNLVEALDVAQGDVFVHEVDLLDCVTHPLDHVVELYHAVVSPHLRALLQLLLRGLRGLDGLLLKGERRAVVGEGLIRLELERLAVPVHDDLAAAIASQVDPDLLLLHLRRTLPLLLLRVEELVLELSREHPDRLELLRDPVPDLPQQRLALVLVLQHQHVPVLVVGLEARVVPVLDEVVREVRYRLASQVHSNVVPRQSRLAPLHPVPPELSHPREVGIPHVVVLHPRVVVRVVAVDQVLAVVEPREPQVKPSHEGLVLVNYHDFLVMAPEGRQHPQWMLQDLYRWRESLQSLLNVG